MKAPFHRPGVSYSKHHRLLPTDSFNCVLSATIQLLRNLSPHPKHSQCLLDLLCLIFNCSNFRSKRCLSAVHMQYICDINRVVCIMLLIMSSVSSPLGLECNKQGQQKKKIGLVLLDIEGRNMKNLSESLWFMSGFRRKLSMFLTCISRFLQRLQISLCLKNVVEGWHHISPTSCLSQSDAESCSALCFTQAAKAKDNTIYTGCTTVTVLGYQSSIYFPSYLRCPFNGTIAVILF